MRRAILTVAIVAALAALAAPALAATLWAPEPPAAIGRSMSAWRDAPTTFVAISPHPETP
jgi:hypothetical protein